MEDSSEAPSDQNKISPEKNKKRILKTPSQVKGLENFYNEHKYPSEEQKLQLAEQLGLTEKQVSGWFCHRRLKDKRLCKEEGNPNGRQDHSSGVVQDRGSGHKQDSCGSTKQGECQLTDPREAESRRPYGHVFRATGISYECKTPPIQNLAGMDDTSSDSSLRLQDKFTGKNVDTCHPESSKYLQRNGVIMENHVLGGKNMGYKPSGYLKVRGRIEHDAITAVKKRLGRNYREDGPPLAIEFQLPPPGAFGTPISNPVFEDPGLPHSPVISGSQEEPNGLRYGKYGMKTSSQDQHAEEENPSNFQYTGIQDSQFRRRSKQMPFLRPTNTLLSQNFSSDTYEVSAGRPPVFNIKSDKMIPWHGAEAMVSDSLTNCHTSPSNLKLIPYLTKNISEQTEHCLYKSDISGPKTVQRTTEIKSRHSGTTLKSSKSPVNEARGSPKMMHYVKKESKPYRARKIRESHDQARVTKRARVRDEFRGQGCVTKDPPVETLSRANHVKGAAGEVPSSFSEDETAETSSSLN